ncbi:Uncharacterised protein [Chlamydia trachomatis]|nr:Uncharacterised protein [Chlamydia trachomatis]
MLLQEGHTSLQSTEERGLLLLYHLRDDLLLLLELCIVRSHQINEGRNQSIHKWLVLIEESIGIPHRSTENTPNHIACLGITWQLPVRNTESDRTDMVGNHTHSNILLLILSILKMR